MFLLIRRSCIIALYANNGCIVNSPYLDPYGETDIGCKRHRTHHLQSKRYEELRTMWLKQSIPTVVARKLESGMDSGEYSAAPCCLLPLIVLRRLGYFVNRQSRSALLVVFVQGILPHCYKLALIPVIINTTHRWIRQCRHKGSSPSRLDT